tara:strand:+ start:120 stop:797 length:678 start_codon:yes stop_codon:yes gene_type:complete
MEQNLLSRAQLTNIVAVEEDAVAFWIQKGLLESVEKGERKHKRFDDREVRIAIVLRELRGCGMNVAAMGEVVAALRSALQLVDLTGKLPFLVDAILAFGEGDGVDEVHARIEDLVERLPSLRKAWKSEGRTDLYADIDEADLPGLADRVVDAAQIVPAGRCWDWLLASDFMEGGGTLAIYKGADGRMKLHGGMSENLPAPTVIALDLSRHFAIEWLQSKSCENAQ